MASARGGSKEWRVQGVVERRRYQEWQQEGVSARGDGKKWRVQGVAKSSGGCKGWWKVGVRARGGGKGMRPRGGNKKGWCKGV